MSSDVKRFGVDALVSVCAFFLSVFIGLYVYRLLWSALSPDEFSAWFLVFEVSQFLLLLDLGFSHRFIADFKDGHAEGLVDRLNGLRCVLLLIGIVAFIVILLVVSFFGVGSERLKTSYILLGLSIALTLSGYAETAALRVQRKNRQISFLAVFSQILFLCVLIFFKENIAFGVGVAVFVRAFVTFVSQVRLVQIPYRPIFHSSSYLGGEVVAINLAYFSLFMIDALLFGLSSIPAVVIAGLLVVKKYFDLLRSLWDNVLPNAYSRFGEGAADGLLKIIYWSCAVSYFFASACSGWLIPFWMEGFKSDPILSLSLGFSFFAVSLFRVFTLRMYYLGRARSRFALVVALSAKFVFALALIFHLLDVFAAYLVQGLIIMSFLYLYSLVPGGEKNN
ncbi:hypothetical protein [Zoogloea oryzae]|uniref:hypothetical protein n=1 Tax=Zoogloea oryzae TaxID=310767 RepID=UPI0024E0DB4A|nr:hypothetical protein [Zoogloea oryzae]